MGLVSSLEGQGQLTVFTAGLMAVWKAGGTLSYGGICALLSSLFSCLVKEEETVCPVDLRK